MANMNLFRLQYQYYFYLLIFLLGVGDNFIVSAPLYSSQELKDKSCTVEIESQEQFDAINYLIVEKIEEGYNRITVQLKKKEYYFKDRHLTFEGKDYSDVTIMIKGNKSKIVASVVNQDISLKQNLSYISDDNKIYEYWTPVYYVDSLIEVIDFDKKICAAKCAEIKKNAYEAMPESYIQVTQWYHSKKYKITRIEGDKIFFVADDLKKIKDDYSINYDYFWHKKMPRIRLCNVESRLSKKNRHTKALIYSSGCFLRIGKSHFNSFVIDSISFVGNKEDGDLISVSESSFHEDCIVKHCSFSSMRGGILCFKSTDNILISDNSFTNVDNSNYRYLVSTDKNCENTIVERNLFNKCGFSLSYSICVFCEGGNYIIRDNTFVDFGYCAIRCGLYYQDTQGLSGNGVVEHNVIYYTKNYLSNISQYGLIDGGAIYIATKNDNLIVRYNYIHDISGAGSNRGIYCDDGAKNFSLYGNIILNVKNSKCIDARLDPALERFDKTQVANVNKVIKYNIINGGIILEGKPIANNGCVKGANIILFKDGEKLRTDMIVSNVETSEEDIYYLYKTTRDDAIVVPLSTRRELKELPFYKRIKKYIKVR